MKICIIDGGTGARSAIRGIRQLNNDIQIDLFTSQNEVDYPPCEPPFVLRGSFLNELVDKSFYKKVDRIKNLGVVFDRKMCFSYP